MKRRDFEVIPVYRKQADVKQFTAALLEMATDRVQKNKAKRQQGRDEPKHGG